MRSPADRDPDDPVEDSVRLRIVRAGDFLGPRWVPPLFLVLAIALVPWIVYIALSLPSRTVADHYRLAWVGFDILLLVTLSRTAWLAFKGSRQVELPATATATLLIVDAWFDITTSHPGWPQMEAIALALFVELPTAALALYISTRIERIAAHRAED